MLPRDQLFQDDDAEEATPQQHLSPFREVQQHRVPAPPSFGFLTHPLRPNPHAVTAQTQTGRSDPLDFNGFMDDVYSMFPFN